MAPKKARKRNSRTSEAKQPMEQTAVGAVPSSAGPNELTNSKPRPNNAWHYREDAGLKKVEIALAAKVSVKTVARIEQESQGPSRVSYHRYLNALNAKRREQQKPELRFEEVFPALKSSGM